MNDPCKKLLRNIKFLMPVLLAGLAAGCSGGSSNDVAASPAPTYLATSTAVATSWSAVKWGGGGYVTGILYHPTTPNLRYARTDVGGAYRWDPATSTWTPLTDGVGFGGGDSDFHGAESLAVDPTNDQLLYMVAGTKTDTNGRIYISSNRGNTWTWVALPFPVMGNGEGRGMGERLQLDPTNPSTMFYGSRTAGLWKSADSGHTWSRLNLGSVTMSASTKTIGVESVIFDNSNVGSGQTTWIIYAAVAPDYASAAGLTSSLYKSTNGGFSWTPVTVPTPATGYYIPHMVRSTDGTYYLAFNQNAGQGVGGPSYLYKYVPYNGTWTQLASSTSAGYGGVSIYGSGSTTRIALCLTGWNNTSQEVQLSDDAGATWREIEVGMGHTPTATDTRGWNDDIKIDPFNRDHIAHLGGNGIVETWGASSATPWWNNMVPGMEETATLGLTTPPAGAPYKLLDGSGDNGAWVYTDLTTRSTNGPMPMPTASNGTSVDMAWSDPLYIATTIQDNANNMHVGKGFWSGDGGTTWSAFATLPDGAATGTDVANLVVTARNMVVWAPPNVVPSYTTNNGASWIATNLPAPSTSNMGGWAHAYRLKADRKNPNKVYAYDQGGQWWGNPGTVYVSTDGGHNFTLSQGSVAANLKANYWADTSMEVNPNAEGDIWLADGNAVYHSLDSGATWTKLTNFASVGSDANQPVLYGATTVALGKAAPGATYSAAVYVVGTINGVWGLYHSDDGGASWARFNDDTHQFGGMGMMAADWNTYGRVYVGGSGRGVLYTN
jgi:hypothetical protein